MRGIAGIVALACTVFTPAMAASTDELVDEARTALLEGDSELATQLLFQAEEEAPNSEMPVLKSSLAGIQYYLGMVEYLNDNRSEVALGYFRASLTLDPSFSWDTDLLEDLDPQRFYELLRTEVRSRPQVESGVLDTADALPVFLNGAMLYSYDSVLVGRHLVQVLCDEDRMSGRWVEFEQGAPDYGCICDASLCREEKRTLDLVGLITPDLDRRDLVFLGTGGSLVLAGVVLNVALVKPLFEDITYFREHAEQINRAEADELTAQFNASRWATLGMFGTGLAMATLGLQGSF